MKHSGKQNILIQNNIGKIMNLNPVLILVSRMIEDSLCIYSLYSTSSNNRNSTKWKTLLLFAFRKIMKMPKTFFEWIFLLFFFGYHSAIWSHIAKTRKKSWNSKGWIWTGWDPDIWSVAKWSISFHYSAGLTFLRSTIERLPAVINI